VGKRENIIDVYTRMIERYRDELRQLIVYGDEPLTLSRRRDVACFFRLIQESKREIKNAK